MTPYILLCVLFATVLGGCFGSFLNVVVWRLPNRLSVVRPGSFCPRCHHPIRFFDNIPVFAWFFLRGKCRDCREPIPLRYPLVEAIGALIALAFALKIFFFSPGGALEAARLDYADFLAGKKFLPPAIDQVLFAEFCRTVLWSVLSYFVLAAGLMEYDGHTLPKPFLKILAGAFLLLLFARLRHWVNLDLIAPDIPFPKYLGAAGVVLFLLIFYFKDLWGGIFLWLLLTVPMKEPLFTLMTLGVGVVALLLRCFLRRWLPALALAILFPLLVFWAL